MPALPYGQTPEAEPYQTVRPDIKQADDYQNIQTNPEMFGGEQAKANMFAAEQIGQSGQRIAQSEESLGTGALKAGQFLGQVAADDAYNNYTKEAQAIMSGDASKVDEAGNPTSGYLGMRGKDAVNGRGSTEQQLDDLRKRYRESLSTPDQQLIFDQNSRRFQATKMSEIGTHYEQQAHEYAQSVNKNTAESRLAMIAADPYNDALTNNLKGDVVGAYVRNEHLANGQSADAKVAADNAIREIQKTRALAIAAKDPLGAMNFIDANRAVLGTDYAALVNHVKAKADRIDTLQSGAAWYSNSMIQYGTTGSYTPPAPGSQFSAGPIAPNGIPAAPPAAGTDLQGFIKQKEESDVAKLTPYDDGTGHLTIGFGHTGPDVKPGMTITKEQAQSMLDQDLGKAGKEVDQVTAAAGIALTPQQRNALISLQFNTGALTAQQSTIRDKLQSGDMAGAAAEFDNWNHITVNGQKQVSDGLTKRRAEERAMFEGQQTGNHAEFLRANGEAIIQGYVDHLIATGKDPEAIRSGREYMQSQISAEISRTEKSYKVDNDQVFGAISDYQSKGQAPPSLEVMASRDPKIAQTIQRIRQQQPQMMATLRSAINTAQREVIEGGEHGDGPGFMKLFQQVYPPDKGESKISKIEDLQPYLDVNNPDHITYAGFEKLKASLIAKNGKEKDAILKQAEDKTFLDQVAYAKRNISNEMQAGNFVMKDPAGEDAFEKEFMPELTRAIRAANTGKDAKGSMSVLDPTSPDYVVDKLIVRYKPTPAQQAASQKIAVDNVAKDQQFKLDQYISRDPQDRWTFKSPEMRAKFGNDLMAEVAAGRITVNDARGILDRAGYKASAPISTE